MGLATSWQLLLLLLYYPIKKLQPIRQSTFHFNQAGEKREKFVLCLLNHGEARSRLNCILYNAPGNFWSAQIFVGGVGRGGQSLPFPLPHSPASRTFVPLCLPTPALHCVASIFRLIKRIRNLGLTFKLCQNLTFLFIFWPFFWRGIIETRWKLLQVSFLKLSFANLVWPSLLTSRCRDEGLVPLCNVIVIAI